MILENPESAALFLDFDGTLVDFASTPEGVHVPEALLQLLSAIDRKLDGALALVSGRSVSSLSALVPLPVSMAGSHGAEWRYGEGAVNQIELDTGSFAAIKASLLNFAEALGLIVEDKGHAVAVHYRRAPEHQQALDDHINQELNLPDRSDVRVIRGNCVREIQPAGVDKGVAIARFMGAEPFLGRTPVYIGDDTTDEDAFAWVNRHGGLSIKVGPGETTAKHRLADCGEVFAFLRDDVYQQRALNDSEKSGTGADR